MAVWNILHDDRDVPHVVETLLAASPDVIGLSEVTEAAWATLEADVGAHYPTRIFFDELALFSRLPVEDIREIPVEYGRKAQLLFTLVIDGARVDVALLHLHAPHVDDPTPAGVWRMLDEAERGHADEVGFALRRLKQDLPRVVMGDFNSLPFDDTRRRMAKRGFRDAAAELAFLPASTWRGPLFGIETPLRIDYVFVSDGITPTDLEVKETRASDHAALIGRYSVSTTP
jgi:endonuclease/exonuclease/phosphatase (EEP) superfamily protein YafD